ncbi:MAG: methyl-accepting chemotaxis protein [Treponema sp.]|nr:methyl-accepting chemotaxis protein [Treponema sp.]
MSSFMIYLILFLPSTYVGVIMMSCLQKCFLHGQPEMYLSSLPITMAVTTALSVTILIMMKFILRPMDAVVNRLQRTGEEPGDEDRKIVIKAQKVMNTTTVIFTVVGFIFGNLITMSIAMAKGTVPFELPRIIMAIFHSISFGGVATLYTINLAQHLLEKKHQLLKIRNLTDTSKKTSLSSNLFYMIFVSVLAVAISIAMVSFQIANHGKPEWGIDFYLKWSVIVGIITFVLAAIPIYMVVKGLTARINESAGKIKEISEQGDLTGRIDITVSDDIGFMTGSVNMLMDKLSSMLADLRKQANSVSSSANVLSRSAESSVTALTQMEASFMSMGEAGNTQNALILDVSRAIDGLKSGSAELSDYMVEQGHALKENAASITEMAENINSVANMTKKADELSGVLASTSSNGNGLVNQAVVAISEIQKSSVEVQNIVKVIQKIASQTNLLSMNAAIEAAHAGEYGAGFAVVADEVRSLAASSSKSAKDIQIHIKSMVEKINNGVDAITQAGKAFNQIEECVMENQKVIQTLFEAMEEQRRGAAENMRVSTSVTQALDKANDLAQKQNEFSQNVKDAMDRIVEMTKEFANLIDEGMSSTNNLKESVRQVEHTVSDNLIAVSMMENNFSQFTV